MMNGRPALTGQTTTVSGAANRITIALGSGAVPDTIAAPPSQPASTTGDAPSQSWRDRCGGPPSSLDAKLFGRETREGDYSFVAGNVRPRNDCG
jgi:hypothetical protein